MDERQSPQRAAQIRKSRAAMTKKITWDACPWRPADNGKPRNIPQRTIDVEVIKASLRGHSLSDESGLSQCALALIVELETHLSEAFLRVQLGNKEAALRLLRRVREIEVRRG